MPTRDDESRIRILEAYAKAKRADPRLTQGQFMMHGAPGSNFDDAKTGRFANEKSAARYFRKVKSGQRTGGAMYRESAAKSKAGLFQAKLKLREQVDGHDQYVSQNIMVAGGRTTFDLVAAETEFRKPENFKKFQAQLRKYKDKYAVAAMDFDPSSLELRPIRRQHAPIRLRFSIQ